MVSEEERIEKIKERIEKRREANKKAMQSIQKRKEANKNDKITIGIIQAGGKKFVQHIKIYGTVKGSTLKVETIKEEYAKNEYETFNFSHLKPGTESWVHSVKTLLYSTTMQKKQKAVFIELRLNTDKGKLSDSIIMPKAFFINNFVKDTSFLIPKNIS